MRGTWSKCFLPGWLILHNLFVFIGLASSAVFKMTARSPRRWVLFRVDTPESAHRALRFVFWMPPHRVQIREIGYVATAPPGRCLPLAKSTLRQFFLLEPASYLPLRDRLEAYAATFAGSISVDPGVWTDLPPDARPPVPSAPPAPVTATSDHDSAAHDSASLSPEVGIDVIPRPSVASERSACVPSEDIGSDASASRDEHSVSTGDPRTPVLR